MLLLSHPFATRSLIAIWIGLLALHGFSAYASNELERKSQSIIRATPYFAGGEHRGFRLYAKSESDLSTFESMGFRSGDLLIKVDGQNFTYPPAPTELFDRLDRGEGVVVTIERSKEIVEFSVQMN